MAKLGKPESVVYTSKGLTTGLTNIKSWVRKPDGSIVGPFPLTEMSHAKFKGIYTFDFATDEVNDEHGVYVGVIESPDESNHRASFKISYEELEISQLNSMVHSIADSLALIKQADIDADMDDAITEIDVEIGI